MFDGCTLVYITIENVLGWFLQTCTCLEKYCLRFFELGHVVRMLDGDGAAVREGTGHDLRGRQLLLRDGAFIAHDGIVVKLFSSLIQKK